MFLANLDPDALHPAVKRGIAPPLSAKHNATFWGQSQINGDDFSQAQARALLIYEELEPAVPPKFRKPRTDDCLTEEEKEALRIISSDFNLNARQVLEKLKGPFALQCELVFNEVHAANTMPMQINCYTDGGVDHPTISWAAIPGIGIWWPEKPQPPGSFST